MTLYIGIDPGHSGAVAVLSDKGIELIHDMPLIKRTNGKHKLDLRTLSHHIVSVGNSKFALENVHAMPNQGVTSMFTFGYEVGAIEGMLAMFAVDYTLVSSQTWKKYFGLIGKDKNASRELVKSLFPPTTLFDRVKDDGRAEATLMALWMRDMIRQGIELKWN